MYTPAPRSMGLYRYGKAGLAALLLCTSTGAVMAAIPGCRVVAWREELQIQKSLEQRVHHSAKTLARWRVGAEVWSRAHHGKVYRGHPVEAKSDWKPQTFSCSDAATLDVDGWESTALLLGETAPEFGIYAAAMGRGTWGGTGPAAASFPEDTATVEAGASISDLPLSGSRSDGPGSSSSSGELMSGAGGSPTFPAGRLRPVSLNHTRLQAPDHPPEDVALLPVQPLPLPIPTPEPAAVLLLSTGLAALGAGRVRRWFGRSTARQPV